MNKNVVIAIAFIIGLAVFGYGVYLQFFEGKGYVQTTATITQIDQVWTGYDNETNMDEYDYTVYVEYTVDGKDYTAKSDFYEDGLEKGQEITVYYNPSDPSKMVSEKGIFPYVLMGIGAVIAIGAVVVFIREKNAIVAA